MKLATVAVTLAVAASTINALDRCSLRLITSITNSDEAKKCSDESEFSFLMASITGSVPEPEQYAAICKSTSCQAVIQKLYAAVPTDCKLLNGKNLKEVVKQCPTTALVTVADASKTATNESEAVNATDAAKPAELPANVTVVEPSTPAPATNASEPVPTTNESEVAPANNASETAPAHDSDASEELPSDKEIEEAFNIPESKSTEGTESAPATGDAEEQPATDAAAGSPDTAPVIVIVDNEQPDESEPAPAPATEDSEPAPATNASQPAPATNPQ